MKAVFTVYVGGEYDRNGRTLNGKFVTDALTEFMERVSREFGGVTMLMGWGGYLNGDGTYVQEKSARLEIVAEMAHRWRIRDAVNALRVRLNAESILITETALSESFLLSDAAP